jgi:hypothetical protein
VLGVVEQPPEIPVNRPGNPVRLVPQAGPGDTRMGSHGPHPVAGFGQSALELQG